LNQLFRISKKADNRTGITRKINSLEEIGGRSVWAKVPVDEILDDIEAGKHMCFENLDFLESIKVFSEYYVEDKFLMPRFPGTVKAVNSLHAGGRSGRKKSGYKECWSKQMGWKKKILPKPKPLESGISGEAVTGLFEEGKIFLMIFEDDIGLNPEAGKSLLQNANGYRLKNQNRMTTSPYI
jgi:hypothetical protein